MLKYLKAFHIAFLHFQEHWCHFLLSKNVFLFIFFNIIILQFIPLKHVSGQYIDSECLRVHLDLGKSCNRKTNIFSYIGYNCRLSTVLCLRHLNLSLISRNKILIKSFAISSIWHWLWIIACQRLIWVTWCALCHQWSPHIALSSATTKSNKQWEVTVYFHFYEEYFQHRMLNLFVSRSDI